MTSDPLKLSWMVRSMLQSEWDLKKDWKLNFLDLIIISLLLLFKLKFEASVVLVEHRMRIPYRSSEHLLFI